MREGYIHWLMSRSLTLGATKENNWTLDVDKIQKANLKIYSQSIDYLKKVKDRPIHFRAGIKSNQYWLDCMEYVASGELQNDFRARHIEDVNRKMEE